MARSRRFLPLLRAGFGIRINNAKQREKSFDFSRRFSGLKISKLFGGDWRFDFDIRI
jgi:hypothetical protein